MNEKKAYDQKVSWGSWKGVGEILVHVALALCVVYVVYSFFHRGETESDNLEKAKAERAEKQGKASGGYRMKLDTLNPKSLGDDAAAAAS